MMKIVVCTGGFDPVHSGHIKYLKAARSLGDQLCVGLNSDSWLENKKGRAFMPFEERKAVLENLRFVDKVLAFDDSDGSAKSLLQNLKSNYSYAQVIFANGGDRTKENIPEMSVADIDFVFGVGGEDKANSSSWILEEWKSPKTERSWGYYRVLHEVSGMKVKELTVNPRQRLSMQRHEYRNEYWIVSEGEATVDWNSGSTRLTTHKSDTILQGEWHQLINNTDQPLKIVEIQYGTKCIEEDIERKN
jgi:cytidyltransferase-like protein